MGKEQYDVKVVQASPLSDRIQLAISQKELLEIQGLERSARWEILNNPNMQPGFFFEIANSPQFHQCLLELGFEFKIPCEIQGDNRQYQYCSTAPGTMEGICIEGITGSRWVLTQKIIRDSAKDTSVPDQITYGYLRIDTPNNHQVDI